MSRQITTEEFVKRAVEKHGSLYDYSVSVFIGSKEKTEIKCPKHGIFTQRVSHHLSGNGCPKCARRKSRMNTEEFISKAKVIHGDRFDYSKVKYHRGHENVCFICSKHGEFFRSPSELLKGKGCPSCGKELAREKTKLTKEEFIEKANQVHKNKYDYSKVIYSRCSDKICIVCPIHGDFLQIPSNHLSGRGCTKCGIFYSTDKFIEKANKVHGIGRYNYSKVDYKSTEEKICIVCPTHGEFWQIPHSHLQGYGCISCAHEEHSNKMRYTTEDFIKKSKRVHGNLYDYSMVDYKGSDKKVCIICPTHGKFWQTSLHYSHRIGCPYCNTPSKGESTISQWLTERNIEFIHHHFFSDLKGNSRKPLSFDFYVKYMKCLIEYDGEQHFNPVQFNGISEEKSIIVFKKTQYHDELKNQYCIKNSIPLIRINYKEFKDISEILEEKLQGVGHSNYKRLKYSVNELTDPIKIERDRQSFLKAEEEWNKIKDWNPTFVNWHK